MGKASRQTPKKNLSIDGIERASLRDGKASLLSWKKIRTRHHNFNRRLYYVSSYKYIRHGEQPTFTDEREKRDLGTEGWPVGGWNAAAKEAFPQKDN